MIYYLNQIYTKFQLLQLDLYHQKMVFFVELVYSLDQKMT